WPQRPPHHRGHVQGAGPLPAGRGACGGRDGSVDEGSAVNSADPRPLVAVLDYGIGNLRSAEKALVHVGADARLTADRRLIEDAAAVVLPGVGAFGRCLEALRRAGLEEVT